MENYRGSSIIITEFRPETRDVLASKDIDALGWRKATIHVTPHPATIIIIISDTSSIRPSHRFVTNNPIILVFACYPLKVATIEMVDFLEALKQNRIDQPPLMTQIALQPVT